MPGISGLDNGIRPMDFTSKKNRGRIINPYPYKVIVAKIQLIILYNESMLQNQPHPKQDE
jgi:hypothetical protein